MKSTKGDWCKQIGGYEGIYYNGNNWVTFKCDSCMKAEGLISISQNKNKEPRVYNLMMKMLNNLKDNPYTYQHNVSIHNQWIQAGKPIKK